MTEQTKALAESIGSWADMRKHASGWMPLLDANRLAVDNWVRASEAIWRSTLALSQQMAAFTQTRLREDIAVCEKLARCDNPSKAAECQRDFNKTATAQYLDHVNKLSSLMAELVNAAFDSGQSAKAEPDSAIRDKAK
ncbi:MAG TPA: phasin family protein [Alphaproteobacteria bacterium]|nr:phasin family protein [Alphaproteobacteria bacterium]